MAQQLDLPIVVTPPSDLKVNMTYKMMDRLVKMDFPCHRALMNHLDHRLVEPVVREGFCAGLSVGPLHVSPTDSAALVDSLLQSLGSVDRVVVNSSLQRGSGDILAIPKMVVALRERGVELAEIQRLVYDNAVLLYGTQVGS
jgi:predicted metal-dependent TIM-barrel fold hydrolase